jgi:hypothetical protein
VIQKDNIIVPIEVKSAENIKSRSLRVYFDTFNSKVCIRTFHSGYLSQDWIQNIPLYGFQHWLSQTLI